jgi:hypothetical protein
MVLTNGKQNGQDQQNTSRTRQKIIFCRAQNHTPSLVLLATMATSNPTSLQVKRGKGKNFCADEERQLVLNFLLISQDPVCDNGQQSVAFWQHIVDHSNKHKRAKGTK